MNLQRHVAMKNVQKRKITLVRARLQRGLITQVNHLKRRALSGLGQHMRQMTEKELSSRQARGVSKMSVNMDSGEKSGRGAWRNWRERNMKLSGRIPRH